MLNVIRNSAKKVNEKDLVNNPSDYDLNIALQYNKFSRETLIALINKFDLRTLLYTQNLDIHFINRYILPILDDSIHKDKLTHSEVKALIDKENSWKYNDKTKKFDYSIQ